jgi:hypothetical protein
MSLAPGLSDTSSFSSKTPFQSVLSKSQKTNFMIFLSRLLLSIAFSASYIFLDSGFKPIIQVEASDCWSAS